MPLKFRPNPSPEAYYEEEIIAELERNRDVSAFFLIYGYIESYMREWILLSGSTPRLREDFDKKVSEALDRVPFPMLALMHLLLGNIGLHNYNALSQLSKFRNILAHKLVAIDLSEEKNKNEIIRKARAGISICNDIFYLYRQAIEQKAKRM